MEFENKIINAGFIGDFATAQATINTAFLAVTALSTPRNPINMGALSNVQVLGSDAAPELHFQWLNNPACNGAPVGPEAATVAAVIAAFSPTSITVTHDPSDVPAPGIADFDSLATALGL